jgi:predicted ABC-class ATPase
MQALVPSDKEPITPLIQRVRQLWEQQGISVVLVAGGSGGYFSVADRIIMMDNYQSHNVTVAAKLLAGERMKPEYVCSYIGQNTARIPRPDCISSLAANNKVRIKAFGTRMLQYCDEEVPLLPIEQLVDSAQALTIGHLIGNYHRYIREQKQGLDVGLKAVFTRLQREDFDVITPYPTGFLAMPRFQELFMVVNRMRLLTLEEKIVP